MRVIKFEDKYRDDLIFMILEAKNALGRVPGLNEVLLHIEGIWNMIIEFRRYICL